MDQQAATQLIINILRQSDFSGAQVGGILLTVAAAHDLFVVAFTARDILDDYRGDAPVFSDHVVQAFRCLSGHLDTTRLRDAIVESAEEIAELECQAMALGEAD